MMNKFAEVEIIQRTELAGGRVIVTAKRAKPHLTRKYATFVNTPTSRYASPSAISLAKLRRASEAAALHEHGRLVHLPEPKNEQASEG